MIEVAAGVITKNRKILLAQRPSTDRLSNLWEFPGGKLEVSESAQTALVREIQEEFGMAIDHIRPLIEFVHTYESIELKFYSFIAATKDEVRFHPEHQAYRWLELSEIKSYDLAPADWPILEAAEASPHLFLT